MKNNLMESAADMLASVPADVMSDADEIRDLRVPRKRVSEAFSAAYNTVIENCNHGPEVKKILDAILKAKALADKSLIKNGSRLRW
jgi:hypothetical protein